MPKLVKFTKAVCGQDGGRGGEGGEFAYFICNTTSNFLRLESVTLFLVYK